MNMQRMANVIDLYVEDHENDRGGESARMNNAIVMRLLHCTAQILRLYDQQGGISAASMADLEREVNSRGFRLVKE